MSTGYGPAGGGAAGPTGPTGATGPTGPTGATGATGAANISATLNRILKATPDGTTGGNSTASDDGTTFSIPEILDVLRAALGATTASGIILENPTASDAGTPVQTGPRLELIAHVRVGGADRAVKFSFRLVPTVAGAYDVILERDLGAGAGYAEFGRLTGASAIQGLSGLYINRILVNSSSGGLFWDADGSRVWLESDGGIALSGLSSTGITRMIGRSTGATDGNRIWRKVPGLTPASAVVFAWGHDDTWTQSGRAMADGVIEGPAFHYDTTTYTAGTFAAALHTLHKVDLSGSAVTATLPQATDANAGKELMIVQTVGGTGDLTLGRNSGNIEGAASDLTIAGLASAPYRSVRLVSVGATFGWKVTRST